MSSSPIEPTAGARAPMSLAAASLPGFSALTQVSVITTDVERTIVSLRAALGAGSFKIVSLDAPALFDRVYGGRSEPWSMRLGISWIGDMQIEVIQPLAGRSVFRDYLDARRGRAGIQHVFLKVTGGYDQALRRLEAAGYPLAQHARMNAKGRLGVLPMPALPGFLAGRYAARFGYTSTQSSLKIDVEVAKFPPGVSQRLALRAAIAERWIPDDDRAHFERAAPGAVLRDIDAVYVLGRDIAALAAAYGRLTERPIDVGSCDPVVLPGSGQLARVRVGARTIFLVEPAGGPLGALLAAEGEGVRVLRGRPLESQRASIEALTARGWRLSETSAGALAVHDEVPFALWLAP